jgi:predicted Ser/Thr protein kinase
VSVAAWFVHFSTAVAASDVRRWRFLNAALAVLTVLATVVSVGLALVGGHWVAIVGLGTAAGYALLFVVNRSGAVNVAARGFVALMLLAVVVASLDGSQPVLFAVTVPLMYVIPITVAGAVLSWRGVLGTLALTIAATTWLYLRGISQLEPLRREHFDTVAGVTMVVDIVVSAVGIFVAVFNRQIFRERELAQTVTRDSLLEEIARIEDVRPTRLAMATAIRTDARLGRFVVRGELGRGGMGIVYRAEDERLQRIVAVKVLRADKAADPGRRARFLREARSAASLVHANVATLYEIGEADGELFLAMELVEGRSLRADLDDGAFPTAEALRVAKGIARGLSAAHERGIVHRDLKPENVMRSVDGEPKILDFGLAKLHESPARAREPHERLSTVTEAGLLLGTPEYMAPEQARAEATDARADVFSFGVVLFEMLTGTRPFRGHSTVEVIIAVARDPHPRLLARGVVAPAALEAILDRCLAKTAADRYANAREVLADLERV